jgi:hypothetical protein
VHDRREGSEFDASSRMRAGLRAEVSWMARLAFTSGSRTGEF